LGAKKIKAEKDIGISSQQKKTDVEEILKPGADMLEGGAAWETNTLRTRPLCKYTARGGVERSERKRGLYRGGDQKKLVWPKMVQLRALVPGVTFSKTQGRAEKDREKAQEKVRKSGGED